MTVTGAEEAPEAVGPRPGPGAGRRELVYLPAACLSRDLDHPAIARAGGAVISSLPAHALPQLVPIEHAIRLNGAAVDKSLAAFAWGRAAVARPELVRALLEPPAAEPEISSAATDPRRAFRTSPIAATGLR